MKVSKFTCLLLIHLLFVSMISYAPVTIAQDIPSPIFDDVIGTFINIDVYDEGTSLEIKYHISGKADGIRLLVNGSGFEGELVDMVYLWRDSTTKYFSFSFAINNYTTFRAFGYEDSSSIQTPENYFLDELNINYHRLWTENDKYPEFESISAESQDVINNVQFEYYVSNSAVVRYRVSTQKNISIVILTSENQNFDHTVSTPMIFDGNEGNYKLFSYTLSLSAREMWFTVLSENSFEYIDSSPTALVKRRIHNGFRINNSRIEIMDNGIFRSADRVTDVDCPSIKFDVINETNHEYFRIDLERHYFNKSKEYFSNLVYNRTNLQTINNSRVSSYLVDLPQMTWKDQIIVTIRSFDLDSNQEIGVNRIIPFTIHKWGVIAEFETPIQYTASNNVTLGFYINDVDDQGLSKLSIITNNEHLPLHLDQRQVNIHLQVGQNKVTLNATNGVGESSYTSIVIHRDVTLPSISNLNIIKSDNFHRLVANISENDPNDTGIGQILISTNGVTISIGSFNVGTENYSLFERLILTSDVNNVVLKVVDLAGNSMQRELSYILNSRDKSNEDNYATTITISMIIFISVGSLIYLRRKQ